MDTPKMERIRCPVCEKKTRLQIREDTELKNFLYAHNSIEQERSELLNRTIAALPKIQRRRFLLYYEYDYDYNYYEIGAMENCTAQAVRRSVIIAREKIKAQMKHYLCAWKQHRRGTYTHLLMGGREKFLLLLSCFLIYTICCLAAYV